ncbi:ATP-binding cassette glutathione S-conjugate transporter ycf1 [Coemansia thaxteri]|nr:ATP-binding cassette glutathione S-conjugate transporter ycf1 [Coemansia thaxteri]
MYLTKNCNGLSPQIITKLNSSSWRLKMGFSGVFDIVVSSISELFNIYIVVNKLGWGSVVPILVTLAYIALSKKLDAHVLMLRNNFKIAYPPKFQQMFSSICQHMKTIKLYAWESVFIHNKGYGSADFVAPTLVWLAQFIMLALNSSLSEIAASLAIISQLRPGSSLSYIEVTIILASMGSLITFTRSLGAITLSLNYIAETEAAIAQIVESQNVDYITQKPVTNDVAVAMSDCEFSWGKDKFALCLSSLSIKKGEFVTIKGRVGCGKSSLVSAICGEMPLTSGEACVFGRIGYVSQKPWIMNATFRENILLDDEFDEKRYNEIIKACALAEDLEQLPAGDMSEIGHSGINLSGGQKVRLALAR